MIDMVAIGTSIVCLAQNIYFEARDQPTVGQLAVSSVVLNRVHDDRWPNTVCDVVKEGLKDSNGYPIKDKCQFSWYCDGESDTPKDAKAWRKATRVAEEIFYSYGVSINLTDNAMFYHSVDVEPKWSYKYVVTIGDHIFYK